MCPTPPSRDVAENFMYESIGSRQGPFVLKQYEFVENTDWTNLYEMVVYDTVNDFYWACVVEEGATEIQEDVDPFNYDEPEWVAVAPREVVKIVYEPL